MAVRQKRQSTAQPACVEMQIVWRFSAGMNTVSMVAALRLSRAALAPHPAKAPERSAPCRPTRMAAHNLRQRDRRFAREPLAQRGGQIRHRRKIESPLGIQRVINLRAAIGRLAERLHQRAQFVRGFSQQIAARKWSACEDILIDDHSTLAGDCAPGAPRGREESRIDITANLNDICRVRMRK